MSKRRSNPITSEDLALWEAVKQTAAPIHKIAPAALPKPPRKFPTVSPSAPAAIPAFKLGQAAKTGGPAHKLQPAIADRLTHAPLRMDHGAYKKLTRGKMAPEGRIDLHGMTLAEAHSALISYILAARSAGKRLVLVITGKGKSGDDVGPIPRPRGVLRHQVPHWLHSAPLTHAVQQVTPAHARHGGHGAYYVYLRK